MIVIQRTSVCAVVNNVRSIDDRVKVFVVPGRNTEMVRQLTPLLRPRLFPFEGRQFTVGGVL